MDDGTKARAAARRAARLAPARQHGAKDAVLQDEVVAKRGQGVEAGEPQQRVAEHAMHLAPIGELADWGEVHGVLGDALMWLAGFHALAALYHHFVLKDGVLRAMLPGRR